MAAAALETLAGTTAALKTLAGADRRPWTEKHRPQLRELRGQEGAVALLEGLTLALAAGEAILPLYLLGPPGSGKSSAAMALRRSLGRPSAASIGAFGGGCGEAPDDPANSNWILVNAARLRGQEAACACITPLFTRPSRAVRTRGRNRRRSTASDTGASRSTPPTTRAGDGGGGAGTRVLVLDEMDRATAGFQAALLRPIECSRSTVVIMIANSNATTRDALVSRAIVIPFPPLGDAAVACRLAEVAALEGVALSPEALARLVVAARGDLRVGVGRLQLAAALAATASPNPKHLLGPRGGEALRLGLACEGEAPIGPPGGGGRQSPPCEGEAPIGPPGGDGGHAAIGRDGARRVRVDEATATEALGGPSEEVVRTLLAYAEADDGATLLAGAQFVVDAAACTQELLAALANRVAGVVAAPEPARVRALEALSRAGASLAAGGDPLLQMLAVAAALRSVWLARLPAPAPPVAAARSL